MYFTVRLWGGGIPATAATRTSEGNGVRSHDVQKSLLCNILTSPLYVHCAT